MNNYLALLRGINVGGKNRIKMAELKACVEAVGFEDVRTYIQSGNVLFSAGESDQATLARQIEDALSQTFAYEIPVVVHSGDELQAIVTQAPEAFGSDPDTFRYDVIFLKDPLTPAEAMQWVSTRAGVDQAFAGNGVLYFARRISRAGQSHLNRIISTPIYQQITIRNWNTTSKLWQLIRKK